MMKAAASMIALAASAGSALAQTDTLYAVGTFGSNRLYAIQGASVINSNSTAGGGSGESGIAVFGDIRTTDYGSGTGPGAQYDLGLNWTGTTYPFVGGAARYDGTTDGRNNYAFQYGGSTMYSYDRDWQKESAVCSLPDGGMLGITYDGSNGTFWGVSLNYSPTKVMNFDASGTVLSSFFTSATGNEYGLAYEASSDSLWTIDYSSSSPRIHQYSKGGANLQNLSVSSLFDGSLLGIEFDVPAPGSLALLGLGGLAATRRRRA